MMPKITAVVTLLLAVVAAMAVVTLSGTHNAHAATLTPTTKTCAAFRTWNVHRTTAHLNVMMEASLAAPWHNLGNDVNVVYADVRGGNHTDLPGDVAGITTDCKGH